MCCFFFLQISIQIYLKKYISPLNFVPERPHFLCKIPLLTQRPLFFVIFASQNALMEVGVWQPRL